MTWNPALTNLRSLLAELYPTEGDAHRAVDDAGLRDMHIEFGGSAANMWHSILRDADRRRLAVMVDWLTDPRFARRTARPGRQGPPGHGSSGDRRGDRPRAGTG